MRNFKRIGIKAALLKSALAKDNQLLLPECCETVLRLPAREIVSELGMNARKMRLFGDELLRFADYVTSAWRNSDVVSPILTDLQSDN